MGAESGRTEAAPGQEQGLAAVAQSALRSALEGRYTVEAEVAHGAMGTVLRAHDLRHDRPVAIKVLRPELATSVAADRFLREVHTAARLTHPNIVAVHDSGEAGGLLYYVMPYVEGEALSDRLARTGPLGTAEALRITREVAEALAFAQAHGVVHRDIKPANILLAAHGHALVTDFGIARALSDAADAHLTSTGAVMGSPLYVSPEQAAGDALDGRADVYSLGCVLYEMLCGRPPFEAPTLLGVLSAHMAETPRPPSALRPDIPAAVERLVLAMLRKVPAERCDAAQLLTELDAIAAGTSAPPGDVVAQLPLDRPAGVVARARSRRPWFLAGGAMVAVAALVGSWFGLVPEIFLRGTPPDSTRYVVLPFRRDAGTVAGAVAADRLRDALLPWQGIEVIDPGDAGVRLSRADSAGVESARAHELARAAGAGRFVAGRITREGDSLRVYAQLGDAALPARAPPRAQVRLVVPARSGALAAVLAAVADSLVLAGIRPECVAGGAGTRSLPALRACDRAFGAFDEGELASADSLLTQALRADPRYARAALWLAQLRGWLVVHPSPSPELLGVASRARPRLSPRDSTLLEGLQLMNAGRYADACAAYGSLVAADSQDVAAWLGLGECHRRDDVVVRDSRSPSGWAFRSSYERAVQAYRKAFEIRPQIMKGWKEQGFAAIWDALFTSTAIMRTGKSAPPDTFHFSAQPDLSSDTLRFTPFPVGIFTRAAAVTRPAGLSLAVDRERRIFRELVTHWAAIDSRSPESAEAVAVSLDLMGDPSAITEIGRARARARKPADLRRIARDEVWLRVKFGLPDRVDQLARARMLADSLLGASPESADGRLSSVALLVGHARRGAALARLDAPAAAEAQRIPTGLMGDALALVAFAGAGAAGDSLRVLADRLEQGIRNSVAPQEQPRVRNALLLYPVILAFPAQVLPGTARVLPAGGYLGAAILASMGGDTAGTLAELRRVEQVRAVHRPADLSIDALLVEAVLLERSGKTAEAANRVGATLDAARWLSPMLLDQPGQAASLVRAMALRADLAARMRDRATAARWARAVVTLWAGADPELGGIVARMRTYLETKES